jgi:adenine phosphoribosyltransferase
MKDYLRKVDTSPIGRRCDVTPLLADAGSFRALVEDLAAPFAGEAIDAVACIDALGFILGTAIAWRLGVAVVAIRKGGKLPVAVVGRDFVDYSGQSKRLELRKGLVAPGARVVLVDEWIETGAQVRAAAQLVEAEGATIAGIAALFIEPAGTEDIRTAYRVHTVWPPGVRS